MSPAEVERLAVLEAHMADFVEDVKELKEDSKRINEIVHENKTNLEIIVKELRGNGKTGLIRRVENNEANINERESLCKLNSDTIERIESFNKWFSRLAMGTLATGFIALVIWISQNQGG